MTPLHPARRRAERFATLVEGEPRDTARADDAAQAVRDAHTAELLELVGALRSIPAAQARPEFVTSLRERLMVAAQSELGPVDEATAVTRKLTLAPRKTTHERRVAAALAAFAIIGATTSMAVAAQSALPGDALYPLKRAIENTHTSLSVGDEAKGSTLLGNANRRLGEVRDMTKDGDADPADVRGTLNTFTAEVNQASGLLMQDYQQNHDQKAIDELRDFAASGMSQLSDLEQNVPQAAEQSLLNAAKTLFTVDAAAGQVCPQCTSTGITEIPPTLLASAGDSLDTAQQQLVAAGPLATPPPASGGAQLIKPHNPASTGSSGGQSAPADPVTVPSLPVNVPTPPLPTGGLGGVLPSVVDGLTNHHKSKNPKPHQSPTSVGDVVNDVVGSVVDGVDGVLGGLSGQ
jgi:hypothetical protein